MYEDIYGVGLLDDLHNYFPALLYEQGRFQNVNQIFHYIRSQMSERFNLYSYGASRFRETQVQQPPLPQRAPTQIPTRIFRENTNEFIPLRRNTPFQQQQPRTNLEEEIEEIITSLGQGSILRNIVSPETSLLFSLLTPRTTLPQVRTGWTDPVVVRPSLEVIEQNSTIVTSITGQACAICQEQIQTAETCRRLSCTHTYHRGCIDTWFQRSTRCPTCRHDIRERFIESNNIA